MHMYMHAAQPENVSALVNLSAGGEVNLTEVVYLLSSTVNDLGNQTVEPVISEV